MVLNKDSSENLYGKKNWPFVLADHNRIYLTVYFVLKLKSDAIFLPQNVFGWPTSTWVVSFI